jgi:hypothetical protein
MKRTFAAVVTTVTASTSIWLATAPAYARAMPPQLEQQPSATVKIVPRWTYQGGKLAVITECTEPNDFRFVTSQLLRHPVNLRPNGGNLLIRITGKSKPQKYTIALWCVSKSGLVDSVDLKWVTIVKHLRGWKQPPAPPLPPNFKANVTVQSGPPAPAKTTPHRKKNPKKGH